MTEQASDRPLSIDDLSLKMRLEGRVESIGLHGAIVDIGLEYKGLLHVSQLSPEDDVDVVTEALAVGDDVTVWVTDLQPDQKRVSLTMVEPADVMWNELREGQIYPGRVTRIEQYGAFVDLGAERPGLLHVREMSSGYVDHPSELVKVGDEIDVRILRVDRKRRRIDLTRQGMEEEIVEEPEPEMAGDEQEETPQTAMEIAMERARADRQRHGEDESPQSKKPKAASNEREDILERTLRQHSQEG
ncbi:MAG: S1 RNA-binding domain-containing protein [Anaerolineae bacterium]